MYDILILSAEKDLNKVKFLYESINKHLTNYNKIHCVCNVNINDSQKISDISYYNDDDILDFDFSKFKGNVLKRSGWYKQQYIKMFQDITIENYLVIDSDIFFNKDLDIDINKPNFYLGRDQYHEPYFYFMKKMLNIDRVYNHSFINEIMLFKKNYIKDILDKNSLNKYEFFNNSVDILNEINQDAALSEYELYGNFITKYYPKLYNYKNINTYLGGKKTIWYDYQISEYIKSFENSNFDIISMHTWI